MMASQDHHQTLLLLLLWLQTLQACETQQKRASGSNSSTHSISNVAAASGQINIRYGAGGCAFTCF
jgi:hypothetical protein